MQSLGLLLSVTAFDNLYLVLGLGALVVLGAWISGVLFSLRSMRGAPTSNALRLSSLAFGLVSAAAGLMFWVNAEGNLTMWMIGLGIAFPILLVLFAFLMSKRR